MNEDDRERSYMGMLEYKKEDEGVLVKNLILGRGRPATHPDLIGISRFFSTNLGASFSFEIGKTKGRLTLLHGPCLQTHKVWTKNKCYDRLNPFHIATQLVK